MSRDNYSGTHWTTADELEYIRNLGGYSSLGIYTGRRALLLKYIEGHSRRTSWGAVNAEQALQAAREALAGLSS